MCQMAQSRGGGGESAGCFLDPAGISNSNYKALHLFIVKIQRKVTFYVLYRSVPSLKGPFTKNSEGPSQA